MRHCTPPKGTAKARANWCGPYAIAVLLRLPTYDQAYDIARRVNGLKAVRGLRCTQLWRAISAHNKTRQLCVWGQDISPAHNYRQLGLDTPRPTLTQWYRCRPDKRAVYLVVAGHHFLVIHGTRIIDNWTLKWEPFHARKHHKRARVAQVWRINYERKE